MSSKSSDTGTIKYEFEGTIPELDAESIHGFYNNRILHEKKDKKVSIPEKEND